MNDQLVAAAIADGVTVAYGRNTAVDNVSFAIQRGTVYALLGRNGAGKSSLVRCLLGQQKPQRGRIQLFGQDVWRDRAQLMERVGIVAEEADAPPEMRIRAIAAFCRRLYSRWDQAAFDERLRRFSIPLQSKFGDLSKGQKKEVGLALALSSTPELVVLDDPTLGLDVVARKALFEEVIAELADRGITVFLTTHDLGGVETIADRVGIMVDGKLVVDEELELLKSRFRRVRTHRTHSRSCWRRGTDRSVCAPHGGRSRLGKRYRSGRDELRRRHVRAVPQRRRGGRDHSHVARRDFHRHRRRGRSREMSKAIAIAQREIQERAMVLVAAAAVAAAPFLALLMPGGTVSSRLEGVKVIGSGIAASFILGLAMLLGASIVGREAREKRLSFYFARPVGGSAVWFGKMTASLFLLASTAVIMFIPPLLITTGEAHRGLWSISTIKFMAITLAIGFSLVPLIHAAATMARSRSLLLAVDFVAAVAFVVLTGTLLMPLIAHYAIQLYFRLLLAVAIALVLMLLLAGGWQLAEGRTDVRRSHRMLSAFLWSGLAVVVVVLATALWWITAVGPEDLKERHAVQIANGNAVLVGGLAKHRLDYAAAFLVDTASGRLMRVSPSTEWNSAVSTDGRTAAWLQAKNADGLDRTLTLGFVRHREQTLMTADLSRDAKAQDTGIEFKYSTVSLALSDDGSLVAIYGKETLSVFDLATRKSVGSARIPGGMWSSRVQFLGRDEVRVYTGTSGDQAHVTAWSYVPARRSLTQLLDYTTAARWFHPSPSPDGKRLFVRINRALGSGPGTTMSLATFDLTTGKQMAEVAPGGFGMLLADGSIAALSTRGGNAVVTMYDAAGAEVRKMQVAPATTAARFVGMIEPSVVALATAPKWDRTGRGWKLNRVDLSTGAVTPIATDVAPILKYPFGVDVAPSKPKLQQPMVDANGDLVVVDIATGARRKLL